MATDLRQTKTAKAAGAKHDAFVQAQLGRAEKRIRMLDIAAALLGFAAIVCVAVAAVALCDYTWALPAWARQVCFAVIVVISGIYLIFTLGRPLLYRVNPYYAAKVVEQTMPEAKNSVVSWLDLQQEKVAPAIRAAVGQKAAKDLSKADIDRAFSARRVLWAGAVAAVCAVIFVACFVRAGSGSFFRVLAPFSFGSGEARTSITITKPANGDDTVTMGQAVAITVHLTGKAPDPNSPHTVRVLMRYQEGDPYKSPLWMQPEGGGDYTATVQPIDVSEGFYYKIVAGDAETPEYRITVRGRPLLTKVQAKYHFRPYTGWADEPHSAGRSFKIEALRGTEISLAARTNRPVHEAALVLEDADGTKERLAAEKDADDAFRFKLKFVVEKTSRYHLEYTTPEGESYTDPNSSEIVAIVDKPPEPVDLAPPREIYLPCNGLLQVEGAATDDIGVKSLALRMREVTHKIELKDKLYRSDEELRLQSGGYALKLAYKDFVDLNTVQTVDGKLLALQKDMVLEYWLEASDACDYPKPGVTASKHYKVTLLAPEKDQDKLDKQRNQAQQDQREHEKKQNDALQQEAAKRLKDSAEKKISERPEDGGDPSREKKPSQSDDKQPDKGNPASSKPTAKEIEKKADELKAKLDAEAARQKKKSESKPGPQNTAAQAKNSGEPEKKPQPAEAKPQGQPDPSQKPGEIKPAEQQSDPKNAPAQSKPDTAHPPQLGENKPNASPPNAPPKSEGKENAPPKQEPPGEAKSAPPQEMKKESSQNKPDPQPSNKECTKGECKSGGKSTNPNNKNAVPKPDPSPVPNAADGKNAGPNDRGNDPKAQEKPGGSPSSGESKPPPKEGDDSVPPADEKNTPSGGASDPRKAKSENVANAAQNLKSDDPKERQQAAKELKEIADKAQDDKVRKQAQEELEDAGLKPGKSKAPPQKDQKGMGTEETSEAKDHQGDPKEALGQAKDGKGNEAKRAEPKDLGKPNIKDNAEELTPEEKAKLEQRREEYLKKLEQDLKREGKFDEQKWREFLAQNRGKVDPQDITLPKGPNGAEPPEIKDREHHEQRASMLQLREFLKSVDPKVLKDAGISEEQYREFLKNYADLALREEQKKEILPPSQHGNMSSVGGTRENPGAKANSNDPAGPSRSKAPPGYGDAWKRFTQDLNSTADKK